MMDSIGIHMGVTGNDASPYYSCPKTRVGTTAQLLLTTKSLLKNESNIITWFVNRNLVQMRKRGVNTYAKQIFVGIEFLYFHINVVNFESF